MAAEFQLPPPTNDWRLGHDQARNDLYIFGPSGLVIKIRDFDPARHEVRSGDGRETARQAGEATELSATIYPYRYIVPGTAAAASGIRTEDLSLMVARIHTAGRQRHIDSRLHFGVFGSATIPEDFADLLEAVLRGLAQAAPMPPPESAA